MQGPSLYVGGWLERLHRDLVLKQGMNQTKQRRTVLRLGSGCPDVFSMEESLKSLTADSFLCLRGVNTKNAEADGTRTE